MSLICQADRMGYEGQTLKGLYSGANTSDL